MVGLVYYSDNEIRVIIMVNGLEINDVRYDLLTYKIPLYSFYKINKVDTVILKRSLLFCDVSEYHENEKIKNIIKKLYLSK